jgi:hypothetical protein
MSTSAPAIASRPPGTCPAQRPNAGPGLTLSTASPLFARVGSSSQWSPGATGGAPLARFRLRGGSGLTSRSSGSRPALRSACWPAPTSASCSPAAMASRSALARTSATLCSSLSRAAPLGKMATARSTKAASLRICATPGSALLCSLCAAALAAFFAPGRRRTPACLSSPSGSFLASKVRAALMSMRWGGGGG